MELVPAGLSAKMVPEWRFCGQAGCNFKVFNRLPPELPRFAVGLSPDGGRPAALFLASNRPPAFSLFCYFACNAGNERVNEAVRVARDGVNVRSHQSRCPFLVKTAQAKDDADLCSAADVIMKTPGGNRSPEPAAVR
jgi:hypothetical protein